MFNVILFGPPGSGKGTQSEKLVVKYHLKHLSTGDLLRSEINNKTPLGLEAKNLMDKGHLVPDEVVIGMICSALDANPQANGFLFDGFPRTSAQAEALDKLLELKKTFIAAMLALEVSEDEPLYFTIDCFCLCICFSFEEVVHYFLFVASNEPDEVFHFW